METVGLRELRQDASDLVRRVQSGEDIVITVSGRPSARLVPVRPARWHNWSQVADLFDGPSDPDWIADQELIDHAVRDPWTQE
ncbi:MAG TPA: type II toxin-antitoxin system prevent-host-death family antitoxin [Marmoricola sp.]|nr:type II toxin-antitoxin system prevent-host-death family antitoxin [Marmoricola sp.]